MFTCGLSDLVSWVVSLVVFVLREYILKEFTYSSVLNINYARSEILASCLVYIDQWLF